MSRHFLHGLLVAVVCFLCLTSNGSATTECDQIRDTLLQYAQTQCGSELLNVLPPLMPNSPIPSTTTPTPTQSSSSSPSDPVDPKDVFIGSYYPNWFVYRKHYMGLEKFGVMDVDISPDQASAEYVMFPSTLRNLMPKLTHLYYAFLNVDENCFVSDKDPDASWYGRTAENKPSWIQVPTGACNGAMNDMLSLKSEFPHLNLMISLGGWTFSENFSKCAASEEGHKKMYDSFNFYVSNSDANWGKSKSSLWAGIDFDWEHPGAAADHTNFDPVNDWPNYAKLVQYFRNRARSEGRNSAVFTSAIGVGETLDILVNNPSAAKSFCDALDNVNMMTYDLHGKWDPTTGHNAQFCQIDNIPESRPAPKPLAWAVKDRVEALASICGANKLALGLPNYSPAWTKIPSTNDGLYQTATDSATFVGWSTFSDSDKKLTPQGILSFWDQKAALSKDNSFKVHSKNCPAAEGVVVPVKWMYSSKRGAFACYEDEETVQRKAEWASKLGLRGFFFWDITQDKDGLLLDAARSGWSSNLPINPASGSKQCHDNGRPDFDKNPDGSEDPLQKECHKSGKVEAFGPGDGCFNLKARAEAQCGGKKATAIGGARDTDSQKCFKFCTPGWDNGADGIWADDKVHFICDGESIPEGGNGGQGGSGGQGGNNNGSSTPCSSSCKKCEVTSAGQQQNVAPGQCQADCVTGGVTYWPCAVVGSPLLCACMD